VDTRLVQNKGNSPTLFSFFGNNLSAVVNCDSTSTFVGFQKAGEPGHWLKAFERSFGDFLPLVSLGGDIKVG
jgi:hypothetical protein